MVPYTSRTSIDKHRDRNPGTKIKHCIAADISILPSRVLCSPKKSNSEPLQRVWDTILPSVYLSGGVPYVKPFVWSNHLELCVHCVPPGYTDLVHS